MDIQEFVEFNKSKYETATLGRYVREIEAFKSVFDASTITYQGVQEYFNLVPKTVASVVKAALVAYFNFLIIKGIRQDNPVKSITLQPQSNEVKHHLLLSTEELDMMLEEREERYEILKWRNLFLLSLIRYQALTNSDLLNLEMDAIQEDKLVVRANGKLNGYIYELRPKQIIYWLKYEAVKNKICKNDSKKVFLNKRGFPITGDGITSIVETLKPLYPNVRIHNKILRQSVIVEYAKKTDDLLATQQFARHRWSSTTAKYFSQITDDLRNEVEKLHPFNVM